jgi:hypothetical protein
MKIFFSSRFCPPALIIMVLLLGGLLLPLQAQAVPIVQTIDFINDGTRSHFNGFESISKTNNGYFYTGGGGAIH